MSIRVGLVRLCFFAPIYYLMFIILPIIIMLNLLTYYSYIKLHFSV